MANHVYRDDPAVIQRLARKAQRMQAEGWSKAGLLRPTIVESPFSASGEYTQRQHERYRDACMLHSFDMGEAPFASHMLYTQILDDAVPEERKLGIDAGLAIAEVLASTGFLRWVFYVDLGISAGMKLGEKKAAELGVSTEKRSLGLARLKLLGLR